MIADDLDLQETGGIVAVYLLPSLDDAEEACLIAEIASGPKRFVRLWSKDRYAGPVEFGWTLSERAVLLWDLRTDTNTA